MVHIVIKRRLALIILVFITTSLFAQQQTEPAFVYKDSTNRHLSRLDYFLGTFTTVNLDDCLFASGIFRFRISKENKIINIQVTGDLPDSLVYTIKKRISETEGHWVFSSQKNISISSKWFVLPVFVDRKMGSDCKGDKSVGESYYWLYQLFDKTNKIIDTPTSYLFSPIYLSGIN